jgi:hypothetical protein
MVDANLVHVTEGARINWKSMNIRAKPVKWNVFDLADYIELVFNETTIECNFSEITKNVALSTMFMRILQVLTPNIEKELVIPKRELVISNISKDNFFAYQGDLNKLMAPDIKQPAKISFSSIAVTLHFPEGEWLSIKADQAELEAFASMLFLKGNVLLSSSSNERLSCKEILWNLRDEVMETSGEYEFSTAKGIERGTNRRFLLKKERIIREKKYSGLPMQRAQNPVFTIMNSFAGNSPADSADLQKMTPMQALFFNPLFNNRKSPPLIQPSGHEK